MPPFIARPILAVSSCLLGHEVRYDGGHKRQPWLLDELADRVDFLPICPEVGIGLPVPRPPIQLTGESGAIRARSIEDPSLDVTGQLQAFARESLPALRSASGYIVKSRSPSCGMAGVKRYHEGVLSEDGIGIHVAVIMAALPDLPIAEEQELLDPMVRAVFMERVFAYRPSHRAASDAPTNAPRA